MWDNVTPLLMLKSMPKVLQDEHLEKLQRLLEADKYKYQLISGLDLCGVYAPFCSFCDKSEQYPCAIAYAQSLKAGGTDIDIASKQAASTQLVAPDDAEQKREELVEELEKLEQKLERIEQKLDSEQGAQVSRLPLSEAEAADSRAEERAEQMPVTEQKPVEAQTSFSKKIRIAVARKRMGF